LIKILGKLCKKPSTTHCQTEKDKYVTSEEFAIRLFEIQTKIANIRRMAGWDQKSYKNFEVESRESKPSGIYKTESSGHNDGTKEVKEKELDDLKQKLMRRKR